MAVNCTSIPQEGPPRPGPAVPVCLGKGRGRGERVARVGMGQSPPWGAEERFCGIGSLAKIWAEKFRDSGRSAPPRSPACPATHKQNCNTRKNGSCPLGKKEGHVITRYVLQPAGAAPQARTHNTVNRNTETPGRRGSLRPARSLKHSAGPGKTKQKKNSLKTSETCAPLGICEGGRGGGREPPFPFCLPG